MVPVLHGSKFLLVKLYLSFVMLWDPHRTHKTRETLNGAGPAWFYIFTYTVYL